MPPKAAGAMGKVCIDFLGGKCEYGDRCRFSHTTDLCRAAWAGSCRFGDRCKYSHDFPQGILRFRPNADGAAAAAPAQRKPAGRAPPQQQQQQRRERDADSDDEYGAPKAAGKKPQRGGKKKNTESFEPSHAAPDMRVVVDLGVKKMTIRPEVRDVTLHPLLFTQKGDENLYAKLTKEVEAYEAKRSDLLKSWHGDSHWIADDSTGWKKACPTFMMVIDRIKTYFNMDIKATRFNWYKDQSEWKPFHHDAAAVKPDKAKTQNFTVGVSFGCTRDAAFEDAESKKVVSFPLTNGSTYCFARDTNILWRHGILQVPPEKQKNEGRISIIAWGWVDQDEVNAKPAKLRH